MTRHPCLTPFHLSHMPPMFNTFFICVPLLSISLLSKKSKAISLQLGFGGRMANEHYRMEYYSGKFLC